MTQQAELIGNAPAFPISAERRQSVVAMGLTKREYMAAQIMAATCARYQVTNEADRAASSEFSVKAADALLAELAK